MSTSEKDPSKLDGLTTAQRHAEHRIWWVFGAALLLVLYYARMVAVTFILAFIISYFLNPLVKKLQSFKIPRALAVALVFLVFFGIVGGGIWLAAPSLINQALGAGEVLQDYWTNLPDRLTALEKTMRDNPQLNKILVAINGDGHMPTQSEVTSYLKPYAGTVAQGAAGVTSKVAGTLPYLLLVPILIIYLLTDWERLNKSFWGMVPNRRREEVSTIGSYLEGVSVSYLKGYFKLAIVVAVTVTIVLSLLGVPNALIFGTIAFFMEFIPYIGPLVMAVPPIIMAATSGNPWVPVLVFFLILQLVEGQILAPRIVGQESGLHPLTIIFALLVGGQLAGLPGILIAIPVVSFLKQLLLHYMKTHKILLGDGQTVIEGMELMHSREDDKKDLTDPPVTT